MLFLKRFAFRASRGMRGTVSAFADHPVLIGLFPFPGAGIFGSLFHAMDKKPAESMTIRRTVPFVSKANQAARHEGKPDRAAACFAAFPVL